MGWSFIESLGMQSPFVLWFISGIKHLLHQWYWEVRRNREGNKSWSAHLQGSSNTILLWKWSNRCDLCYIDICKFYANNHLMPEYGPEEESLVEPSVLLAHHSECLSQPQAIPGTLACLALSAVSSTGAHFSSRCPLWLQLLMLWALLTSPQACCPPI